MIRREFSRVKRQQADDLTDPYKTALEYKELSVCRKCRSIYHDKRWTIDEELYGSLLKHPEKINYTLCPACRKIETGYVEGIVELAGDFLIEHKEDILNLINNTEKKANYIDPLGKVVKINMDEQNKKIIVTTTNENLAQRIGKNLEKAYKGSVEYSFSKEDRMVRVYWVR